MRINVISRWFLNFVLAALMSSCAYPISDVYRKAVRTDVDFKAVHSDPAAYHGTLVIWGGEIIRTVNTGEKVTSSCWKHRLITVKNP